MCVRCQTLWRYVMDFRRRRHPERHRTTFGKHCRHRPRRCAGVLTAGLAAANDLAERHTAVMQVALWIWSMRWTSACCMKNDGHCSASAITSHRTASDAVILRSARVGITSGKLCRDRQGRRAAGALVPSGTLTDRGIGRTLAGVVERHDVRIPDAAAGHAHVPRHAARRNLSCRRRRPNRLWQATDVPWGVSESAYNARDLHSTTSIAPSAFLNSACKRDAARRPGGGTIRDGPGAAGAARPGARQPAPPGGRRHRRGLRLV